jgi:thioredoxin-related protein
MRKMFLAMTTAMLVASVPANAGDATWIADFDQAVEVAKKENKNLLVDFTGSDWCGWCIKLHDEVFQHKAFLEAAQKEYVLVALDFPRADEIKAKVPNPERNAELQKKYGVRGFPTILLLTPEGELIGQTGYQKGGPEKYVVHLGDLKTEYATTTKFLAEWTAADDAAKLVLWEKAMGIVGKSKSTATKKKLKDIVCHAMTVDADNAKGMKLRALTTLFEASLADDAMVVEAEKFDAKNEHGLLERVALMQLQKVKGKEQIAAALTRVDAMAKLGIKDKATGFMLYGISANMCGSRGIGDAQRASDYAAKALAIGSDNERFVSFLKTLVIAEAAEEEVEEEEIEEEVEEPKEIDEKDTP